MPRYLTTLCLLATLFSACKKEKLGGGGEGVLLGSPLALSADSLCVQAPNVFTPNGDAINDVYRVVCRNAVDFSITIRNAQDSVVYSSTEQHGSWKGTDPTVNDTLPTAGSYQVEVAVTGTSGAQLAGTHSVHVVLDHGWPCFSTLVPPVFGDQYDPRICGPAYATNDVICVQ